MENWNYAHAASRSVIARRHPYNYEQGQGWEVENYEWDGGLVLCRARDGPDRGQVERAQPAQPVPPLGPIHGGRKLGRADAVARDGPPTAALALPKEASLDMNIS